MKRIRRIWELLSWIMLVGAANDLGAEITTSADGEVVIYTDRDSAGRLVDRG